MLSLQSCNLLLSEMSRDLAFSYFLSCRREQIAELTRLGQTLMHVGRLFWIVADDAESCNPLLDKLMDNFGEHRSVLRACGAPLNESVIKIPPCVVYSQEYHMFIFLRLCPFYIDLINLFHEVFQIAVRL